MEVISITEERRTQLLIRIPESMHKWLKANKENAISDYVIRLIEDDWKKQLVGADLEEQEIYDKMHSNVSPELKRIIHNRFMILTREDFEGFKRDFWIEERNINPFKDEDRELESADITKFPTEVKEYFESLRRLDKFELIRWTTALDVQQDLKDEKAAERQKYRGDPDEIVYRSITRRAIYDEWPDKQNALSILGVAGAFKLSYNSAYSNLIPWLKKEGWRIGNESRT